MNKPRSLAVWCRLRIAAFALLASLVSTSSMAIVESDFKFGAITTYNINPYAMWITIYDFTKTRQLDYGCVEPGDYGGGWNTWKSGQYLWGSIYHVRAEVRKGPSCSGPLICDTTMAIKMVNPETAKNRIESEKLGPGVALMPNGRDQCYMIETDRFGPNQRQIETIQKSNPLWQDYFKEKSDLEACNKEIVASTKAVYAQMAAAEKSGLISGAEQKSFNEADATMKRHLEKDKKDGFTLGECRGIAAELDNMKRDVAHYQKTPDATAIVSPSEITIKSGGNTNVNVRCSSGEPVIGFTPPAGGISQNGGGSFTVFSDSRKTPGVHVGVVRCGYSTTSAKLTLTVTK